MSRHLSVSWIRPQTSTFCTDAHINANDDCIGVVIPFGPHKVGTRVLQGWSVLELCKGDILIFPSWPHHPFQPPLCWSACSIVSIQIRGKELECQLKWLNGHMIVKRWMDCFLAFLRIRTSAYRLLPTLPFLVKFLEGLINFIISPLRWSCLFWET